MLVKFLIQGSAANILEIMHSTSTIELDCIYATYDERIDNADYLPGSTWAEGRNILLKRALQDSFDYVVFCDDDFSFISGSLRQISAELEMRMPAVAMPVFAPKTLSTVFRIGKSSKPLLQAQICRFGDAQVLAIHKSVVSDALAVPLQTQFDKISWCLTSSTQQLLIFNLYGEDCLQLNSIIVTNDEHKNDYPKVEDWQSIQTDWLRSQLIAYPQDHRKDVFNLFSIRQWARELLHSPRTFLWRLIYSSYILYLSARYSPESDYGSRKSDVQKDICPDSELIKTKLG